MTKKYKIHELAKDFDIQSKYVIENLSKHFEGEKKSQTALEEKELDFLFDLITKPTNFSYYDLSFADFMVEFYWDTHVALYI